MMPLQYFGTAAALQFSSPPPLSFEDIVKEFDAKLNCGGDGQRHMTRDCDDIAILDRGPIRVALAWVRPSQRKSNWYLIIAVGPSPMAKCLIPDDNIIDAFADKLIWQSDAHLPAESVLRCEVVRPIDSEYIDLVTELLLSADDASTDERITDEPIVQMPKYCEAGPPVTPPRRPIDILPTRRTDRPSIDEHARTQTLRAILSEADADKPISLPMHLTIYTFSLSMMLQVPPVGIAMLVYTILREDALRFL